LPAARGRRAFPMQMGSYRAILEVFRLADKNGDGMIDRVEFSILMTKLQRLTSRNLDIAYIDKVLAAFDANGDGCIDYAEFVAWAMRDLRAPPAVQTGGLLTTHTFLTPREEARMERETLWNIRAVDNARVLRDACLERLDDPSLLVLSVGSSSTQAYDARGVALSFPVGTNCFNAAALSRFEPEIAAACPAGAKYERVLLINSIGYFLTASDPCLVDLAYLVAQLSTRQEVAADCVNATAQGLFDVLRSAFPRASLQVYNRAKDPETKRHKYPQIRNDFCESLALGRGFDNISGVNYDVIVDWGGKSFKVFFRGARVGTEVMDANSFLCEEGHLYRDRVKKAVRAIEASVLRIVPAAKSILIAQTGRAREVALAEGFTPL